MKTLIIGGGNMGITYAQSFLKAHVAEEKDLMILEKSKERAQLLNSKNVGSVYGSPEDCLKKADLIILAVKPQDCSVLFDVIRPYIDAQQVVLSIMAGVKTEFIAASLGVNKIIRAMPNLPAQIGMGMTVFTSTDEITRIELVTVQNLLNTTGKTIYVESEALIDAATAISGSGPAYVYYFMNAMIKSAQQMGFSESEAELLVGQTFMGSVHLQNRNELSCKDWISKVASKGGTTEAAMNTFLTNTLESGIIDGTKSAHQRAIELGKNK